jgi:hypothetical protein
MKYLKTFESFSAESQLNEFLGIGKMLKSVFKRASEPTRKRIETITKNFDSSTGKISDAKDLANDLVTTFKEIANDKKIDLKDVDSIDTVKEVMKEFLTDIKVVFAAARIPFMAMIAESHKMAFSINEGLKEDFGNLMTSKDGFEENLNRFINAWVKKNGGKDVKKVSAEASKFIDALMYSFEKKINSFGPDRLRKLVALSGKKDASNKDVEEILKSKDDDDKESKDDKDGKEVKTEKGKKQFIDAAKDAIENGAEVRKISNSDGSYDLIIMGVKL